MGGRRDSAPAGAAGSASWRGAVAAGAALLALAAAVQLWLGRVAWCQCDSPRPWSGDIFSMHNSQHLFDPYTFSHVQHGLLFYAALWALFRAAGCSAPRARFVLAVLVEVAWEVIENTPLVIERYRESTISLDYYGDSVMNSLFDSLAMIAGYAVGAAVPVWISAALLFAIEISMLLTIRDSLTLNVLMLLRPFEVIREWQSGAAGAR